MSGALVVSLDFEKQWGVRDRPIDGPYRANILGVPGSVRGSLDLFRAFDVAATWAIVGFLFARTREEREHYSPAIRPKYANPLLDPYRDVTGADEETDPAHYAASLIREIAATPRQEIGTHTFSHFFCLESGEDMTEAFRADIASAREIMRATIGTEPRSIVFPGNQHNPLFDAVLREAGITCYRGNPRAWMWRPRGRDASAALGARAARFLDAYLPLAGMHTVSWDSIVHPDGMRDVASSFFMRPYSGGVRMRRIIDALVHAARRDQVLHVWWHPHNFGVDTEVHLRALRTLLDAFARCRDQFGMESLTMSEIADAAARRATPPRELLVGRRRAATGS